MGFMLAARELPANNMQALSTRKTAIEEEIEVQREILKANNSDLSTPLVDAEGFPRADLDVWAVRTARVRIIELRNDYKAVLDDLSKALEAAYARPEGGASGPQTEMEGQSEVHEAPVPFATIDGIAPGSPAATAVSRMTLRISHAGLSYVLTGSAKRGPHSCFWTSHSKFFHGFVFATISRASRYSRRREYIPCHFIRPAHISTAARDQHQNTPFR